MVDSKPRIDAKAVYSRRETAHALGIGLSTLKKLVDQGYLEVSRPPGMRRIFIKGESILMMLERTTLNPADQTEKEQQAQ